MTKEDAIRQLQIVMDTIQLFKYHAQFHIPGYHVIDPKIGDKIKELNEIINK